MLAPALNSFGPPMHQVLDAFAGLSVANDAAVGLSALGVREIKP